MFVVQAVIETTDEATQDEAEAAAGAIAQAVGMTVNAVPFLASVRVSVYDANGIVVGTTATADGE